MTRTLVCIVFFIKKRGRRVFGWWLILENTVAMILEEGHERNMRTPWRACIRHAHACPPEGPESCWWQWTRYNRGTISERAFGALIPLALYFTYLYLGIKSDGVPIGSFFVFMSSFVRLKLLGTGLLKSYTSHIILFLLWYKIKYYPIVYLNIVHII